MDKYGVQIESWGPFAEGRNNMFTNPTLSAIAANHHKSVAQVILRYLLQRKVVVIPKTTHIERMKENLNVFDFTLSTDDMATIQALDTKTSAFFSHADPAMVEWFAQMVEERKHRHNCRTEVKKW